MTKEKERGVGIVVGRTRDWGGDQEGTADKGEEGKDWDTSRRGEDIGRSGNVRRKGEGRGGNGRKGEKGRGRCWEYSKEKQGVTYTGEKWSWEDDRGR